MRVRLCALLLTVAAVPLLHAGPKLEDIPTYGLGMDALSGRLWEVAANRFEAALQTEELDEPVQQEILIRLVEARIRGNRGDLALELLAKPELAEHPAKGFWIGQALAASGQFQEAIEAFAELAPDSPNHREAQLTRARLQRAVGDTAGALTTLKPIVEKGAAPISAKILKAEILLDQDMPDEALKALPATAKLSPTATKACNHLRARCLLAKGESDKAVAILENLLESPRHQSLGDYHQASIDLARARLALGKVEAAADGLLAFIQKNVDSPLLDSAFNLLMDCLPGSPVPNDPILTRLQEWIPPNRVEGNALQGSNGGAAGAWPKLKPARDPLAPWAMFHLAGGVKRLASPDAEAQARRLLTRLRLEYPSHPLLPRTLLLAGRWELEAGNRERAAASFEALQQMGNDSSPELRAQALTLEASALFQEKKYEEAAGLFDQAANLLESDRRSASRLNAATSLLAAGDIPAFDKLREEAGDPDLQVQLKLERALYFASIRNPEAYPSLIAFIEEHADHPRIDEARLAASLAALDLVPPAMEKANALLQAIPEENRASLPQASLALAEIRYLDSSGLWAEAAARAAKFLEVFPKDPLATTVRFEQGRALFRNRDFTEAQLVFQALVEEAPDSPQAPAALLLSARAAAEGATPQSQEESIKLFDKLIESDSPFRAVALLEKADILIRLSRLEEAVATLLPWFEEMKDDDPLKLSVGLLLGDALFAKAEGKPEELEKALALYEQLLALLPADSPVRYQVLYQKGLTLEQFEDREDDALTAYMDVIQSASGSSRGDWKSAELCGFSALRILEKKEEWEAAMRLARRIADLKGPRSKEADERAKTIGMEHFLWEN